MSTIAILSASVLLWLDVAPQPTPAKPAPEKPAAAAKLDLNEFEQGIIDGTNAQRAKHGLPALEIDPDLQEQARQHASWMTRNQRLQHTSAAVGENIAWNQQTVEEAVNAWMNSSGHRANILNPGYRFIGASAYTATDGSVYWCEQFIR